MWQASWSWSSARTDAARGLYWLMCGIRRCPARRRGGQGARPGSWRTVPGGRRRTRLNRALAVRACRHGRGEGGGGASEPVACVAEGALAECEDLGGRDGEHQNGTAVFVLEDAIADLVLPAPVPLGGPRRGQTPQGVLCGDLDRVSFDDHVQPAF